MKLRNLYIILSIYVIGLIGAQYYLSIQKKHLTSSYKQSTVQYKNLAITVDVADTQELRTRGLSGRRSLDTDTGMLFIFPDTNIHGFWMKEMHFPLDFVWIDGSTVVDLTENAPAPKDINSTDLPIYRPLKPVDKVLEVNTGTIKKLGIHIGDTLSIK